MNMKTIVHAHKRNGRSVKTHERRLKIPKYAKDEAKKWLAIRDSLPPSKQFGLDQNEANRLGIDSGVTRAKRIIQNEYMPEWEVRKVARFGTRFKNCTTPKCDGAHGIWGGRKFEKKAAITVKQWNKQHVHKALFGFGKKKELEAYNLSDPEYQNRASLNNPDNPKTYGKVTRLTGDQVGNAAIVSDVILPSAGALSAAGIYAKKKIDNLKIDHPDETGGWRLRLQGK